MDLSTETRSSAEPTRAAAEGGRCLNHGYRPAVQACARCGVFVCGECVAHYDYRPLCPACYRRASYDTPHSNRAVAALILGITSIVVGCAPLGIPAVLMGHSELSAIEAGEAPAGGRSMATGGIIFGWAGVVLTALFMIIGGLFLWLWQAG